MKTYPSSNSCVNDETQIQRHMAYYLSKYNKKNDLLSHSCQTIMKIRNNHKTFFLTFNKLALL